MRAILIGAAPSLPAEIKRFLHSLSISPKDLRVGVDGGVEKWVRAGLKPQLAVGDWDSLKNRKLLSGIPAMSLAQSKDRSDLFYAARVALELGANELVCLGVTGGRWDHQLAAVLDLSELASGKYGSLKSVKLLGSDATSDFEMAFVSGRMKSWKGRLEVGSTVSVFALGGAATGVTLKGFCYPLKGQRLVPSSRGLSNKVKSSGCEVSLRNGCVGIVWRR